VVTPCLIDRDSLSLLRRVVASAKAVLGGDVPFCGWHGAIVSAMSPIRWVQACACHAHDWDHVIGACRCTSPYYELFLLYVAELLNRSWSYYLPHRVAHRELIGPPTSQGCSCGSWSVYPPHKVAQRELVCLSASQGCWVLFLDGSPQVMGLLWAPRF
jgi:hypothetical protein